jgi:hypothetical protein
VGPGGRGRDEGGPGSAHNLQQVLVLTKFKGKGTKEFDLLLFS